MPASTRARILITGSGGPMGVNVTRSLQFAPTSLRLVGTDSNRYHVPLSLTDRTVVIPPARQTPEYLEAMLALIQEEGIDFLFPTHPVEVLTLAAHRDAFRDLPALRLVLPETETVATAHSKWETWRRLSGAGVPVPPTFLIVSRDDLKAAFRNLDSRPVWVRGAGVPGVGIGVASLPCREVEHAAAWIEHWKGWGGFIASEYLPGRNLTWLGLYFEGRLIACQGRERLEYVIPHVSPSGITGAPAVSRTVDRPDIRTIGEAAVRALTPRPHGPFFVDLTEDRHGQPRVTEINAGRFGTTIHFYTEAGFNFPWLLVRLALGETIDETPIIDPVAPNTWWIRTLDCGPVLLRGTDAPF